MILKQKQYCVDCHFFVAEERHKGTDDTFVFDVKESERDSVRNNDFSWLHAPTKLACSFGVWDEGFELQRKNRHKEICLTDRKDFCFWWKYRKGMLLPAAKVLQEREYNNRKSARDRRITKIGLWIAAIALIVNGYLNIAKENKWWPFCY